MASVNTGNQLITFRYQQEGTAEGFNKLLCGVLPEGVISGGLLTRVGQSNTTIQVDPMQLLIGDGNIIVHVETRESFTIVVNSQKPFVVASFNWSQSVNNYVSFEAKSLTEINSMNHPIILGRAVYLGENLSDNFDYTIKTWCPSSKYNDYFYSSYNSSLPSFNVTPIENRGTGQYGFVVGKGKAIINGVLVEKNSESTIELSETDTGYHKININITSGKVRIDIAVLMNDGSVRYIMGDEALSGSERAPNYPSNGLVIAEFKYTQSITPVFGIMGNNITNIYNNNYMGFSPQVGEKKGTEVINKHTLYM